MSASWKSWTPYLPGIMTYKQGGKVYIRNGELGTQEISIGNARWKAFLAAVRAPLRRKLESERIAYGDLSLKLEEAETRLKAAIKVVDAVREMVKFRNERHGDPSKPEWWQGADFRVVCEFHDFEKAMLKEVPE